MHAGPATPEALLITGTVGVGKTTTAWAIGEHLQELGIPHAVIDLDELRRGWPAPAGDPFNLELELTNLASVAKNYRAAGAIRVVASGVVESRAAVRRYESAVAMPLKLCRLKTDLERVRARLTERHPPGPDRDWHLRRSGELDLILDAGLDGDCELVDPALDAPAQVARRVLRAIGWTYSV
ncbi:adenylyl-sulfate kinase [Kribbella sp. NPDC051620]|uniref:adenylyl-sulfate kinase n=1 Tax=Kribbella sp. NPDC051620 TaxID=3364120 RepID=UPI0037B1A9BF